MFELNRTLGHLSFSLNDYSVLRFELWSVRSRFFCLFRIISAGLTLTVKYQYPFNKIHSSRALGNFLWCSINLRWPSPPPPAIKQQCAGLTRTGSQELTIQFSELKYCYYKNMPLPEMPDCHSLSCPSSWSDQVWIRCPSPGYPDCRHRRTALTRSCGRGLFVSGSQVYLRPPVHV